MCLIKNQLIRNYNVANFTADKASIGKTAKDLLPEIEYNEFKKETGYKEPEETKILKVQHVC